MNWPPLSVAPTKLKGKSLLREIEEEDKTLLQMGKSFRRPDLRSGDVIRFHYLHSLSEGNGNTITGLCIGLDAPDTLMGSFTAVFNFAGVPIKMKVKLNSPFLTDLQILAKGSGNLKHKLDYIWKMGRDSVPVSPIVKRTMATRKDEKSKTHKMTTSKKIKADKMDDPLIIE